MNMMSYQFHISQQPDKYSTKQSSKKPPNNACSGRRGLCGFDRQFPTPEHFSTLEVLSRPAPPPLTPAVVPLLQIRKDDKSKQRMTESVTHGNFILWRQSRHFAK